MLFTYETTGPAGYKALSSVNLLPVDHGGNHAGWFLKVIKDFFMLKAKKYGFTFQANDVYFRLRSYLILSLVTPKFAGQTKDRLINAVGDFKRFEPEFRRQLETFATEKEELLKEYLYSERYKLIKKFLILKI